MNILFICDEYPPGRNGGIGTMVRVLGRELVRQGHSVHVAGLYGYRYGGLDYEIDNGVKVYRRRYGINLGPNEGNRIYNALEKLPAFVRAILNGRAAFKRFLDFLQELIERERIDVIEIPDWNMFTFFIGVPVEWPAFKAPLIVKSNGSYTYFTVEAGEKPDEKFYRQDKKLYVRADALSAVSKYTAEKNIQLFSIQRPVKILYNSIEIPELPTNLDKKPALVIYTGTLVKKKGIFQLMKAWNRVIEKIPGARLDIYGKGKIKPLQDLLSVAAKNTVHFKGHVTRETLFSELSSATMAVFPSYSECFALAPLEAMAVGCPVVNTSRASGRELISDQENGSLIDPDDTQEIAGRIIALIEDKELQKKFSLSGRATVATQFNISRSAHDHILYYGEVIKAFKSR